MYIVYLYNFVDHEKVYIGLSDDLNFQLELEEKYLATIGFAVNSIDVVFFTNNKIEAVDEKKYWLAKTNNINKSFTIDSIPEDFISKSLKDRTIIKKKTEELESEYMSLFYKYETLKDNYKNVDELIEKAISNSIEEWKDQNLSDFSTNNNMNLIYDLEGYDEFGLDIEGFDKYGFDINGYNRDGYDDYNFNKEGIHKDDIKNGETKVYKLEKVIGIQNKKNDFKNTIHKNSITKKDEEIKKLKNPVPNAKKTYKQKESKVIKNIKNDKNNSEYSSFLSFLDAKKFVEKLRLESEADWIRYCNNEINGFKAKPNYIPLNPKIFYKEWISWDDWLGMI